jgi:hypothetical protein
MASNSINFPPLRTTTAVIDENGNITLEALRSLLQLYNGHPLQTVSTAAGAASFPVPYAAYNQNVEITFVKISADGNVPTLTASSGDARKGTDKINGQPSLAMAPAQFTRVKLKSDGVSNWYVTG